MSLILQIIREYLSRDHPEPSRQEEIEEVARVDSINALPLEEFNTLPEEVQRLAEELWVARIVEANVRRQGERRRRVQRERQLALSS